MSDEVVLTLTRGECSNVLAYILASAGSGEPLPPTMFGVARALAEHGVDPIRERTEVERYIAAVGVA